MTTETTGKTAFDARRTSHVARRTSHVARRTSHVAIASLLTCLAVGEPVHATAKRYRIIDVVQIGSGTGDLSKLGIAPPSSPTSRLRIAFNTLGLNDDGMLVGGYETEGGDVHAFLWDASSSSSAPVFTDVHTATFGNNGQYSFANDVSNPIGSSPFPVFIVGQYGGDLNLTAKARGWLWDSTIATHNLHTSAGPFSVAYAVTNESSATVVGESIYVCPGEGGAEYARPFRIEGYTGSGTPPSMTELDVPSPRSQGFSRDVAAASSTIDSVGGGANTTTDGDPCGTGGVLPNSCPFPDTGPIRWDDASTTGYGLGVYQPSTPSGAFAYGINTSRDAVGLGYTDVGPSCFELATMWVLSSSSSPEALPDPPGGALDAAAAEAVSARNEEGCVWVVGVDLDLGVAAAWFGEPDGGGTSFCAAILDDETMPCASPEFGVYRAHDVNRWGHVAVVLAKSVSGTVAYHAGVLTHAADFDGNLRVDGSDLGELLLNWCTSGCTTELVADLDCDGFVDGADAGILLIAWSGSDYVVIEPLCTCGESELLDAGGGAPTPGEVDAAAQLLGFESMADVADWASSASGQQVNGIGCTLAVLLAGGSS